jgi:CTP synthase
MVIRVLKLVMVTGGVMSSVGKGIASASLAMLLSRMGYNVSMVKIDPYINVDAGTMNPYMHGEVFVTEDGGETDLDIGHYERFLGRNLSAKHNLTTGKVYLSVIEKERKGEYLGQTVQIIPHVTNEIKDYLLDLGREEGVDVLFVEIGGTVGDIESLPFLEAARQLSIDLGKRNVAYIHVAYVPILPQTGEHKTKPLQHSVIELRRIGINPDIVVARSPKPLPLDIRKKIALYSNVDVNRVISNHDVDNIYEVPLNLYSEEADKRLAEILELSYREPYLDDWRGFVERFRSASKTVNIAMVGKYTTLPDSYISIREALSHAGAGLGVKPKLMWVESTDIESGKIQVDDVVARAQAAIILPGFGKRGAEGKIKAIKSFRENDKPILGICFGLQLMVVEYARHVLGLDSANSTEINPNTPYPVVDLLEEQRKVDKLGGTMRLGAYKIRLVQGTLVHSLYGADIVMERHRHRYEVNPLFLEKLESSGLIASGYSVEGNRVEFMESRHNKFFVGTQAHPEYKSRPLSPSPLFIGLLRSAS